MEGFLHVKRERLIAFCTVKNDFNRRLFGKPLEFINHGRREFRIGEGLPIEFRTSRRRVDHDGILVAVVLRQ